MATTQVLEDELETTTLDVECGGRTFSPSPAAPSASRLHAIRRLRERREETELPSLLREAILSRLRWNAVPSDETQRQPLIEAYIDSLKQLDGFRRDVENMVRCACLANLEFRQGKGDTNVAARDSVLAAKLDEMLSQANAHWLPLKNVLDAKLASQPVSVLRGQLQTALSDAVADFAKQFPELLARLVDRQLFGLVEWLPNHCCNYHFFKQVIIQDNEGASEPITEQRFFEDQQSERDPGDPRRIIGRRIIHDIQEGQHHHRFARHEHSVMNAVYTTVRNSRVVIPLQVVPLLESIPEWLYPLVRMIDGDIIRERIIEQDTRVEDWTDVQVRDEPIFGCEPAVIIGSFVLTGWGPREIGEEQARRRTVQHTALRERAEVTARHGQRAASWERAEVTSGHGQPAPWFTAVGVASNLGASMPLFVWFHEHNPQAFGFVMLFAFLGLTWKPSSDLTAAPRRPASLLAVHFCAAKLACRIFLFYMLVSYFILPSYWPAPFVIGFVAVLCYVIGGRFQEARLRENLSSQRVLL